MKWNPALKTALLHGKDADRMKSFLHVEIPPFRGISGLTLKARQSSSTVLFITVAMEQRQDRVILPPPEATPCRYAQA